MNTSLESVIKLITPLAIIALLFFREYGIIEGLNFVKRWLPIKIITITIFISILSILLMEGENWFCGTCASKHKTDTFLIPSIGFAIVIFPELISGNTFDSTIEKSKSILMILIGLGLIFYGLVSIISLGHR